MATTTSPKQNWSMHLTLGRLARVTVAFIAGGGVAYLVLDCRLQARCKFQIEQQRQALAHTAAEQKHQALSRFNVESALFFNAMEDPRALGCNGAAPANPQAARWQRERRSQLDGTLMELGARFQHSKDITDAVNEMREEITDIDCDHLAQKQKLDQLKLRLTSLAAAAAYGTPSSP